MLHTKRTLFMALGLTYLPPNWMPYEIKLYQTRSDRMWPAKKSEDSSNAKVPGKQHVTHANSNPPDEPVWIGKVHNHTDNYPMVMVRRGPGAMAPVKPMINPIEKRCIRLIK